MKTILSAKRYHYLTIVGVFLIMAVLIMGMVGCGGTSSQYTLSISITPGGNVTHPGTGTFTYPAGAVVLLEVVAEEGYGFTHWSGNVSTIEDVNALTTTITMSGNYFITANFAYGQLIRTWYDLDDIRDDLVGYYVLMNDLDSTSPGYTELASPTANEGNGWEPIIGVNPGDGFVGSFDGQGYEIRDLFINRFGELTGLFGWVGEGGVIEDIGLVNASIIGDLAGALVGISCGNVNNSYSTATVSGDSWTGGLVAVNGGPAVGTVEGTVTNCYSSGLAAHNNGTGGNQTLEEAVGGLVGCNGGTVINSYSTATVSGEVAIGGLVGLNGGALIKCYSTGSVTGSYSVGGLVGSNWSAGTVTNSFWDTQTSGQVTSDGGTGVTTAQMQDIATFSGAMWNIVAVANPSTRDPAYIWNIVDGETYPFLSWESAS